MSFMLTCSERYILDLSPVRDTCMGTDREYVTWLAYFIKQLGLIELADEVLLMGRAFRGRYSDSHGCTASHYDLIMDHCWLYRCFTVVEVRANYLVFTR